MRAAVEPLANIKSERLVKHDLPKGVAQRILANASSAARVCSDVMTSLARKNRKNTDLAKVENGLL